MYPVKLKFAVSTFLLIFFYFPKSINGHIDSGTCDVKNSCIKHDKFDRKIFFGPQFRERETRMVNVRNRVGSEKLVNNRRIVDSDSRISDDIQSRNFDFPRLSRNSKDQRTNIISRARIIPRLTRDVFETIQTRRDIHTGASRNRVTERDSRNRIETGNTKRALVDNLDRESRTRRIVDVRESRLRESREIRLSTDNVRDFERLPRGVVEVDMARRQSRVSPVRREQASRISRLFNNREINRDSRIESRVTRLGIDSNSREQPSDERRERRSLDVSTTETNRGLLEKESRERETRSHANNHRRMSDRDSRVPPVESRLIIDNRRLTERVERSSQRRDSERASREVTRRLPIRESRDSQKRSLESQTTRLTERVERNSQRRDSERASREISRGLPMTDSRDPQRQSLESQATRLTERVERSSQRRDTQQASREVTSRLPIRASRDSQIRSIESQNTRLTERRESERASREVSRGLPMRDSRNSQIRSLVPETTRLTERVERSSQHRDTERASREVTRLPIRDSRDSQIRSLDPQATRLTERVERSSQRRDTERASREVRRRLPIRDSRDSQIRSLGSQTIRLTERIERSSPDRRNSERASREVNRRLSERDSQERDTRTSHTNDRRVLLDRDSTEQIIKSRVTSQNTMLSERVERRQNSERVSREINNRITEQNARINRESRVRSNEPRQIRERVTDHRHIDREIRVVRSYGINNQRVGDGDSQILTQERSPVRLAQSRRTTNNLDRREQRNTGTDRRDTRDSSERRTGATERTADEIRSIRIQDRRIVSKREMKMTRASNDRTTGEQERQSENRNIRRSDNGRRDARLPSQHPVDINNNRRTDINNNRRITDQQTFADSFRERSNGNQPNTIRMKRSENYIFKWSNLFTTTFGILLLMQIITSSNTKKYGIPQITSFLHGVKEKVY